MEDIVYQFLLQTAGYPRAAIISDTSVLFPGSDGRPSFIIVDPDSAQPLAVIHVVGAVDAAGLYAESAAADLNKNTLRPSHAEGYVVRLDFKGKTDNEKIQFYRSKDKGELYPLTAANFPDLDSLCVSSKLKGRKSDSTQSANINSLSSAAASNDDSISRLSAEDYAKLPEEERQVLESREGFVPPTAKKESGKKSRGHIWLGLLLILLAVADAVAAKVLGEPLLQLTHVLLVVGAVLAIVLG